MDDWLDRALGIAQESFVAGSGPGGQNVNKVATAVQLRVDLYRLGLPYPLFHRLKALAGRRVNARGELVIDARRHRTQEANRADARDRLAALLEEAAREPRKRARVRVNRVAKEQRIRGKKLRGTIKADRGRVDW